jgi:hypothetical protein
MGPKDVYIWAPYLLLSVVDDIGRRRFLPAGYQDSFTSRPRINVTWFSWLTAVAEIGAGLVLGHVGSQARRPVELSPHSG